MHLYEYKIIEKEKKFFRICEVSLSSAIKPLHSLRYERDREVWIQGCWSLLPVLLVI